MNSINQVVKSKLCLGCGFCIADKAINRTIYYENEGQYCPELKDIINEESLAFLICPAKGYNIIEDSSKLYSSDGKYSLELGYVHSMIAAHTNDETILKNASSGGFITQLCLFLLEKKIVDYAVVTQFVLDEKGVRTRTILTNLKEEIIKSQGSKYCPVDMSNIVDQLLKTDKKIAFIGTPCQISAMRQLQKEFPRLKDTIVIAISNFCGGVKSYREIEKLAKNMRINYRNLSFFRYRGGGQPGSLLFVEKVGKQAQIAYPEYTGRTGYSKMLRCHLCVDATAELADIACGDAWLPEFENDTYPWSIILSRNSYASHLVQDMKSKGLIITREIMPEQVIKSQKLNIISKKYRQFSRMRLYRLLGYSLPYFDGGYARHQTNLLIEIKVYLKHKLKYWLEILGIYNFVYKICKRKNEL